MAFTFKALSNADSGEPLGLSNADGVSFEGLSNADNGELLGPV